MKESDANFTLRNKAGQRWQTMLTTIGTEGADNHVPVELGA